MTCLKLKAFLLGPESIARLKYTTENLEAVLPMSFHLVAYSWK